MKINRFAAALSTCMAASAAGLFAFVPTSSAATASPAARHIAPSAQKPSMAERPQDSSGAYVCYDAYVQNIGWQGWACANDGDILTVGTEGQSLRMEALSIAPNDGSVCADAQVQNIGWMGWICGSDVTVGTTGRSLRMEAIAITV